MVIVVTGPAYSGRLTMANAIVSHVDGAISVPVVTTQRNEADEHLPYTTVDRETFESMRDEGRLIAVTTFGEHLYGFDKDALVPRAGQIPVVISDARSAYKLGEYLTAEGVQGICVYMHCSVRTMLFRRATLCRVYSDDDLAVVHDVYGDHSIQYSRLHRLSDSGKGFIKVIPVNSDTMASRSYPEKFIKPLIGQLLNSARLER